ncbi:MAG TPA: PIN domain-containing protein [Spirochaetota bacterium]|nr:PIN domain-containing protein [Spirochaetota bacterium]HRZ26049.1 PIN domain-containing protein [Spirochaetota bacterium]
MKSTLVDAGPLIALFDSDDRYHASVIDFLRKFKGKLITTWPVITEVTHMLSFNVHVQIDFLEWLRREAVEIMNIDKEHLDRIIQLSRKYSNVPMDLADSSLVVIAELTGINDILSIDSDYYIYRTKSRKALNNILLPHIRSEH